MTSRSPESPQLAAPGEGVDRRRFLVAALGTATAVVAATTLVRMARASTTRQMARTVAGVTIPDTPIANAAMQIARADAPPMLFNHSMRVYVFGGILARVDRIAFDEEMFLVGAAFHDLGLIEKYSSANEPFEMDGADAAKEFLTRQGVTDARAEMVWESIAFHTSSIANHYLPQTRLVGRGASVDFYGGNPAKITETLRNEVVAAYPRLGFKTGIQEVLKSYCVRKPRVQAGTWTDAFCQSHTTGLDIPTIAGGLARSPFPE